MYTVSIQRILLVHIGEVVRINGGAQLFLALMVMLNSVFVGIDGDVR